MGLEESDAIGDTDRGGGGKEGKSMSSSKVSCSICLELIKDNGDRSWAKLQCGHEFHLDCIGSAFNAKGMMQCPNCRKIENGQWLFAASFRSFPEVSFDDLGHDEELYDAAFSDVSFGVQWCPFTTFSRLPSSFDEAEFAATAYHDLLGQAIFAEHTTVSSAAHPCPYFAYYGPVHSSSSNSSGNGSDGSAFSSHWSGPSGPHEIPTSYAFPAMDPHYPSWEHHPPPFSAAGSRIGSGDQPSTTSVTQRSARSNFDISRSGSFVHPFLVGHSSGSRSGGAVPSSMIPTYPGSAARTRDRVQALQAYFQPSSSPQLRTPAMSSSRRSNSHRGSTTHALPSDQTGGVYIFPSSTSGRNYPETEAPIATQFHHSWERDHLPSFTSNHVERDSNWGALHPFATGSSSSFRQRHGSERMPTQNRP